MIALTIIFLFAGQRIVKDYLGASRFSTIFYINYAWHYEHVLIILV